MPTRISRRKSVIFVLYTLVVLFILNPFTVNGQEQTTTAFVNVNVVPMDYEHILEGQTVLIVGDRIGKIGSTGEIHVPENAHIIDGEGYYLIPGLADMHVHIRDPDARHLRLYLAHGITTVRNLGDAPNLLKWKKRIEQGKLVGPTIFTTGSAISGAPPGREWMANFYLGSIILLPIVLGFIILILLWIFFKITKRNFEILRNLRRLTAVAFLLVILGGAMAWYRVIPLPEFISLFAPTDSAVCIPADAEYVVKRQFSSGFRAVKIYDRIDERTFISAVKTAKSLGMYSVGHASDQVPIEKILESGMDEIVHVDEFLSYFFIGYDSATVKSIDDLKFFELDYGKIPKVVALTRKNGVRVVPTLVTDENMYRFLEDSKTFYSNPAFQVIRPEKLHRWKTKGRIVNWKGQEGWRRNTIQPFLLKLTKALQEAHVPILLGTDAMVTSLVPGYHAHRELEIFVEAGFSPYEALATGTINAAMAAEKMSGDGNWGTVTPGSRADLILLQKNPLENISNTRINIGVMVRGKWFTQADLKKLVNEYTATFE